MRTVEDCRAFWADVARANGWYREPFYVQIWTDSAGRILDSVSHEGLTRDWVIVDDGCDCLEWQACDICAVVE